MKFLTYKNHNSGVSLIIAIIFVSVFLLVMAGLAESNMKTFESIRDFENSRKLEYLAESAAELASSWAASHGVGENLGAEESGTFTQPLVALAEDIGIDCDLDSSTPEIEPCVNFEVIGHTPDDEKVQLDGHEYYSVPISSTGNAAEFCTVDLEDRNSARNSANDSCHWNKLYVGQRVEIPLYIEVPLAGGEYEVQKADFQTGDFKLRIRTPKCDPRRVTDGSCIEAADGEYRFRLYPQVSANPSAPYRDIEHDPVLIQWIISDAGSNEGVLISNDAKEREDANRRPIPDHPATAGTNTELSAGRINAARDRSGALQDFIVLEQNHQGYTGNQETPPTIASFIADGDSEVWPEIPVPTKPILHLNLVSRSKRDPANFRDRPFTSEEINDASLDIPYLEYQLLTKDPVSDSKSLLTGSVQIPGFYRDFKKNKNRSTTLGGFALESF